MNNSFNIHIGDNQLILPTLPDNSIDSIVTDPPYELGFMGKTWDATGIAYNVEMWRECLRVLKPGGHLLAFSGSRTYHRMAVAIEDAGFQIRDQIMWVYGSGFPKSLNIGKQDGCEEWDGWGTALKPAHEPIVMARKPLDGTVANNVLVHGVGGINIDGCRVEGEPVPINKLEEWSGLGQKIEPKYEQQINNQGRFPANFIHDGSDKVLELFPDSKSQRSKRGDERGGLYGGGWSGDTVRGHDDSGSAARFFYCAKANKKDRNEGLDGFDEKQSFGGGSRPPDQYSEDEKYLKNAATAYGAIKAPNKNHHPTVKPTDLMRYLCRLITPPNGTVLDPFTGSGSTGKAALLEGFNFIGIEQNEEYAAIAQARIEHVARNE